MWDREVDEGKAEIRKELWEGQNTRSEDEMSKKKTRSHLPRTGRRIQGRVKESLTAGSGQN
jgi:hypothetical protein